MPMNDPLSSHRLQQLQPSTFSSQHFPVYGPTATAFLPNELPGTSQSPAYAPAAHSHYFPITEGPRPSYTTTAPPSLQLPKIQPAPLTNGDLKHFSKDALQSLAAAPPPPEEETAPKHVVGSQGRRGILPSATGRPQATTNQNLSNGKNSPALAKDSEGKFPCPHCNKPYLHAKHLKRHMLRPYSRANKKAKQQEHEQQEQQQANMAVSPYAMTTEQMPMPAYSTSLNSPIGLAAMDLGPGFDNRPEPLANQVTRSNELRKANVIGSVSNRGSTSSINTFENAAFSTGHVTPDSVSTSGAATPYTYQHERSSLSSPADAGFDHLNLGRLSGSGYPNGQLPSIVGQSGGRGNSFDWSQFPAPYSHDDFQPYQSGSNTPHHNHFKQETDFAGFEWPTNSK
ncbi:uncharacterized protein KY384_003397 [Bacidia gigantensis]|uniref:uncharacterized protein n=1 Tax=Bacidia gigantensis TaxID=2732470 RepID=UPI001D03F529|nr:uncharacterized protein KY384_003397 [Bacidia gigantensis]KAG8531761.1 hypothetical protein KY384_003397 [Bacidia gigantensis]